MDFLQFGNTPRGIQTLNRALFVNAPATEPLPSISLLAKKLRSQRLVGRAPRNSPRLIILYLDSRLIDRM